MRRLCLLLVLAVFTAHPAAAATLRVPQDHPSIQAAIAAAAAGDTILVTPGRYPERIRLKPGITLRSDGDDSRGAAGLQRGEATILDGGGPAGDSPGVLMAEGSTLDGFTVTHVGAYDDALWNQHFDTQGEQLGDNEGALQAEGSLPAISVQGVSCTVTNCIVHHNGDVGIGILGRADSTTAPLIISNLVYRNMGGGIGVAEGAEPIIRGNICKENLRAGIGCRNASPIITDNQCVQNIRAGIGCREGSQPVIRGNTCCQNRRAGIGIRMQGTAPVVEGNECVENLMAGIGCRDAASPILRNNVCRSNRLAGIGCAGGSPLIVGNVCTENEQAGIGVQGQATAVLHRNKCHNNRLVAIGITEGSTAMITESDLERAEGVPPIIAVKDASSALLRDNRISGGGVAAVLIQGSALLSGNTFIGVGEKQGNAVWVREGSTATISNNTFDGYRVAVNSTGSDVTVTGNIISRFQGTAISVTDSRTPAHVYGNTAVSADPQAKVCDVQGASGIVDNNTIQPQ